MTLDEALKIYKEKEPSTILTINYLDANKSLLFTLEEVTSTYLLENKDKTYYLECKVFNYSKNEINVFYHYDAIIL